MTSLRSLFVLAFVAFAACGGGGLQSVQLVNKTPRTIDSIFLFPPGQPHGTSQAKLAPNETKTLKLKLGNYEIYAVSEKIVRDDKTRETPEASLTIELRGPLDLVFYDSNDVPPGIEAGNTRGIMFRITPPAKPESEDEPVVEPAPEAPVQ